MKVVQDLMQTGPHLRKQTGAKLQPIAEIACGGLRAIYPNHISRSALQGQNDQPRFHLSETFKRG